MDETKKIMKFIKKHRPLYLEKTKLWNGKYYLGYSHMIGIRDSFREYDLITTKDANKLLEKDVKKIIKQLNQHIKVELTSDQFASLVSLIYDIGLKRFITDEMFLLINKNKLIEASVHFSKFNRYLKKPIYRLVVCRKEEKKLWLKELEE